MKVFLVFFKSAICRCVCSIHQITITIDNFCRDFSNSNNQKHSCTDKPRWPLFVNFSSILLLVFLIPNQSLIADKLQDVRTILTIFDPVQQHKKSGCLFKCFFYPELLLYNGVVFWLFKISNPEYDAFLNVIYNPLPLVIVFIYMSSLKSISFCVVSNWPFESSFHTGY